MTKKLINFDNFLKLIKKYTEIDELTPELVNEFIERIEVGEHVIIDGKKTQTIRIKYNGIGYLD